MGGLTSVSWVGVSFAGSGSSSSTVGWVGRGSACSRVAILVFVAFLRSMTAIVDPMVVFFFFAVDRC
jgi:hypothetical protein